MAAVTRPHRRGIGARLWVADRRGLAYELLSEAFAYYGEGAVEGLFAQKDVFRADGVSVVGPQEWIDAGEGVWVFAPVPDEPCEPIALPIVAESEHWIVVDKPHGIATTPRGSHVARSVTVAARRQFGSDVLSPAHRLDADTAGLVLLVKEPQWRGPYQLLFERRRVEKRYHAVARRGNFTSHTSRLHITKRNGIFHANVACVEPSCPCGGERYGLKSAAWQGVGVFGAEVSAFAKPPVANPPAANAITEIKLAGHYSLDAASGVSLPPALRFGVDVPCGLDADEYRLPRGGVLHGNVNCNNVEPQGAGETNESVRRASQVGMYEVRPLTGKTHQIRVAFAHLGLGIVGDRMYPVRDAAWEKAPAPEIAGENTPATRPSQLGAWAELGGVPLQLHAYYLAFRDPLTGEDVELASRHNLALWRSEAEYGQV